LIVLQSGTVNGKKVTAGTVYVVAASSLEHYKSPSGQIHGNVSRFVFGCDPPNIGVLCEGFGRRQG